MKLYTFCETLCAIAALIGATILLGLVSLTTCSVIARNLLNSPLTGDFELVTIGLASSVAWFMPITQWRRANIAVDVFTLLLPPKVVNSLDVFGSLAVAGMTGLLAWRCAIGATAVKQAHQETMLLGLPEWLAYASMVPALGLTAVVALAMAAGVQNSTHSDLEARP